MAALQLQCYVNLLFWYQFFCGFSGTTMIDYWQMIFFNLFFTSLPPLLFGILDKDVSETTLLAIPELYKSGQNSEVRPIPITLHGISGSPLSGDITSVN